MTAKETGQTFKGVFVAMITPMTSDQEVDYDQLEKFADYLINSGVHGLIPLGSTGEFYALSDSERAEVLKVVLNTADGRVPVLAGTNAASTSRVVQFSKQAEIAGANGLLIAPPYYSLPTLDELYEHFNQINNNIGIPIMLYNYPGRTGVDMTVDFVEHLSGLSNVKYVKESTGEITRIGELVRRCGDRLTVFCGADTISLESFLMGATGWVAGIANVLPKEHVKLYEFAVEQQDYKAAQEFYVKILPALGHIENSGKYTQFVKAGCTVTGHHVGPPRMPLLPVTKEEMKGIEEALKQL